ncbi:MAG: cupin domain-containing protein [bacterium]
MPKKEVILLDEVPFKSVPWGRTKIFIGPQANGAEHIRVGVTEYDPETPHEPHAHPGQEEVIWVLSGKGYTETHGERIDLAPGAVAYIPAGLEHMTGAVGAPMTAIIMKSPVKDSEGAAS